MGQDFSVSKLFVWGQIYTFVERELSSNCVVQVCAFDAASDIQKTK